MLTSEIVEKRRIPKFRYFEPKKTPELDSSGCIIGYNSPRVFACSLKDSDGIREKVFPNELGMSADPNNITGFRALVDLINQNRNLSGNPIFFTGADDAEILTAIRDGQEKAKSILENS